MNDPTVIEEPEVEQPKTNPFLIGDIDVLIDELETQFTGHRDLQAGVAPDGEGSFIGCTGTCVTGCTGSCTSCNTCPPQDD